MSTEDSKATLRRLVEEVWNKGDLAVFEQIYAPNFVFHDPALPQIRTREEDRRWIAGTLRAFPDLHMTIDGLIAEGDQAVLRFTARGTNTGDIMMPTRIPATGRQVTVTGSFITRLADGQFVEMWQQVDWLGMLQQLGLVSVPGHPS